MVLEDTSQPFCKQRPEKLNFLGSHHLGSPTQLYKHGLRSPQTWAPMPSWGPLWPWTSTPSSSSEQNHSSFRAGPPNLWDVMPDDLRWSWCNNNRAHNIVMHLNHPQTIAPSSMEKLSSTKPVPGAKKVGNCCFRVSLKVEFNISNMEDTISGIWQGKCLIDAVQLSFHQNPPLHSCSFKRHRDCSSTLFPSSPCSFWYWLWVLFL